MSTGLLQSNSAAPPPRPTARSQRGRGGSMRSLRATATRRQPSVSAGRPRSMVRRLRQGTPAAASSPGRSGRRGCRCRAPRRSAPDDRLSWMMRQGCGHHRTLEPTHVAKTDPNRSGFSAVGVNVWHRRLPMRLLRGLAHLATSRSISNFSTAGSLSPGIVSHEARFLSIWINPTFPCGSSTSKPDLGTAPRCPRPRRRHRRSRYGYVGRGGERGR